MIIKNPDTEKYEKETKAVQENGGYCPCLIHKNEDTKCICKEFLYKCQRGYVGECRCGRYYSDGVQK